MVKKIAPQTPRSAPTPFLPKPVGARGSGPSRLSDLTCSANGKGALGRLRSRSDMDTVNVKELKASKFFGIKKQPQPRVQTLRDDLIFDDDITSRCDNIRDGDEDEMDFEIVSSPVRSEQLEIEDRRSPSPVCSSLASPDADHRHSILTSPDPSKRADQPLGSISQDKRTFEGSPSRELSQTKRRRLPLTQMGSPQPLQPQSGPNLNDVCPETQWDSSSVHEDWPVDDLALVTPREEEEEAELIQQNKESAKKIAQGWKAKWSFDAQVSSLSFLHWLALRN